MNALTKSAQNQVEILAVEDSPTQAEQLRHLLEQQAYKVSLAKDGKQALALLDKFEPALVISDIIMPEMDGYELCKRIKQAENKQDIPVILLTSLSNPEDVVEGLACGADSFITKPFNQTYLTRHIDQLLESKKPPPADQAGIELEISLNGQSRKITITPQRMLGLLLSTYGAAVQRNKELGESQEALNTLNEQLEDLVMDRTAALTAEIAVRRQAEEALRASEERHRVLLASIQSPVLAIRKDITVLYCNLAYAQALDKPLEEIMDKDLLTLMPVLRENPLYEAYQRCLDSGKIQMIERQWQEKYFQERLYPTPWGLLIIADDISERVKAIEAKMQLVQAKEEFIASISHDIRTPLFSLSGYVDLLRKGKVNDPKIIQEFLTRAAQDVERLMDMMNEILDISSLKSGTLKLNLEEVDLSSVIRAVLESLRERAAAKGISLKFIPAQTALMAEADPLRIRRVLVNMVDNAIKFSAAGGAVRVSGEAKDGKITIQVADRGCGIPAENLPRIFDRYNQVRSSAKNTSGRGLGLNISKSIIEAHGGSINVQSQLGAGSVFTMTIPVIR